MTQQGYFAAIRKAKDDDSEFILPEEIQASTEMVEVAVMATNKPIPGWAAEHPVQRTVRVLIAEMHPTGTAAQ